jgi:hypothetical protein
MSLESMPRRIETTIESASGIGPRVGSVLRRRGLPTVILLVCFAACVPELDVDESRIDAPRLLAVRAIPAEAAPNERVTYEALYVDANGAPVDAPLGWHRCLVPPTLDEAGAVRAECLSFDATPEVRETIAFAPRVEATVPFDVCRRFGPDPRVLEDGSTARPASPDATGGYAQPVVVELPEEATLDFSFFEHRIRCNLAGARQDVAVAFRRRYRANVAPEPTTLRVIREDGREETIDDALVAAIGERVELVVGWAACPSEPACGDGVCLPSEDVETCAEDCATPLGCGGAETFVRYDPTLRELVSERESVRAFFATSAGSFETERVGVAADEPTREVRSRLAVEGTGVAHVVLRDSRGGVQWRSVRVDVAP